MIIFPFMFWSSFVSLTNFFNYLGWQAWIKNLYVAHYYFLILSFASWKQQFANFVFKL